MSEFLVELFSEEIPARMQDAAARDLLKKIQDGLGESNLAFGDASVFYTPRRITVLLDGIPAEQKSYAEEIKGPRVGAPEQAINGFLKKHNLQSIDECVQKEVKGELFYHLEIKHEGRRTLDVLGPVLNKAIISMTWPKSMRWGTGTMRWARPLHNILALYDGKIVQGSVATGVDREIIFNDKTRGHRFLGSKEEFAVNGFKDYKQKLADNFVILDQAVRREQIWRDAQAITEKEDFTVRPDEKLLTEIVGIVEYPEPFMGSFEEEFLAIPPEVISTTMRENQRYFTVLDKNGVLKNRFICVANIKPDDGGKTLIYGNEKVLRARLSDARFFWEQDKKAPLETYLGKLKDIRFHEKLGSMYEKAERLETLSGHIAGLIGADEKLAARAGRLCKADLATGMVREFPELQGIMGGHYARVAGEDEKISGAVSTHYSPAGPADDVPADPVAISVALADKFDTIVGFFSIGEKPTGSKDPFALRRAALGIIRIIVDNNLPLCLDVLLEKAAALYNKELPEGLMDFIQDRFRVNLQTAGFDTKIINAVLAGGDSIKLISAQDKIAALSEFLTSESGENLSALVKRSINILKSADGKGAESVDPSLFSAREEKDLHAALDDMQAGYQDALCGEAYGNALNLLAALHAPIQAFFDNVMVMDENEAVKNNRIALIRRIPDFCRHYADFKILSE